MKDVWRGFRAPPPRPPKVVHRPPRAAHVSSYTPRYDLCVYVITTVRESASRGYRPGPGWSEPPTSPLAGPAAESVCCWSAAPPAQ
eukprot:scaffold49798_cov62-Phaeocystis_antarctica.AAC.1